MDIGDIKKIRQSLGITQSELAKLSSVSQSLIAKVEAGKIDPSFTNAKKIFDTLDSLKKKGEPMASDLMQTKIISVSPNFSLEKAISLMKTHGISQIPVIESGSAVGFVSESIVLDSILSGANKQSEIRGIMGECLPIVPQKTPKGAVAQLLKIFPLVLVGKKGKVKGIVTKADLLNTI